MNEQEREARISNRTDQQLRQIIADYVIAIARLRSELAETTAERDALKAAQSKDGQTA